MDLELFNTRSEPGEVQVNQQCRQNTSILSGVCLERQLAVCISYLLDLPRVTSPISFLYRVSLYLEQGIFIALERGCSPTLTHSLLVMVTLSSRKLIPLSRLTSIKIFLNTEWADSDHQLRLYLVQTITTVLLIVMTLKIKHWDHQRTDSRVRRGHP